jgi:hypothetical protein
MTKRANPYEMLRAACAEWVRKAYRPAIVPSFCYPKSEVERLPHLSEIRGQVKAGDRLGYDLRVRVEDSDGAIRFDFVKRPPSPPWQVAP